MRHMKAPLISMLLLFCSVPFFSALHWTTDTWKMETDSLVMIFTASRWTDTVRETFLGGPLCLWKALLCLPQSEAQQQQQQWRDNKRRTQSSHLSLHLHSYPCDRPPNLTDVGQIGSPTCHIQSLWLQSEVMCKVSSVRRETADHPRESDLLLCSGHMVGHTQPSSYVFIYLSIYQKTEKKYRCVCF